MKRTLIISLTVIAILAALGGVAYTFGTPQAPDVVASSATSGATPAVGSMAPVATDMPPSSQIQPTEPTQSAEEPASDLVDPNQAVPAPDPNTPLAIQIPGCRCHSDDPKIVEEHSKYRMNQCAGCHGGKTPTGQ